MLPTTKDSDDDMDYCDEDIDYCDEEAMDWGWYEHEDEDMDLG